MSMMGCWLAARGRSLLSVQDWERFSGFHKTEHRPRLNLWCAVSLARTRAPLGSVEAEDDARLIGVNDKHGFAKNATDGSTSRPLETDKTRCARSSPHDSG